MKDNAQGKPPGKLLTEAEIGKKKDTKAVSVDKPDVKVAKDTQQDASVLPKAAGKELPKKPPAKAQEPPRGAAQIRKNHVRARPFPYQRIQRRFPKRLVLWLQAYQRR